MAKKQKQQEMNDMAFVSDNRPHTLGDLIVITGTESQ